MATKLPENPGHYLWFILDLSYLDVGSVHVMADKPNHHEYLRGEIARLGADKVDFHLYQNSEGRWLTMYHDARDHKPPVTEQGVPCVDDYRSYDFWWLVGGEKPPEEEVDEDLAACDAALQEVGGTDDREGLD